MNFLYESLSTASRYSYHFCFWRGLFGLVALQAAPMDHTLPLSSLKARLSVKRCRHLYCLEAEYEKIRYQCSFLEFVSLLMTGCDDPVSFRNCRAAHRIFSPQPPAILCQQDETRLGVDKVKP